jgi:hypothetical protein
MEAPAMSWGFILSTDSGVVQAAITNENGVEVSTCGSVFISSDIYVPLYRSVNRNTNGHLHTIYIDEYDDTVNDGSHVGEGIAGHCFAQPQATIPTSAVYRGYNPTTDDHLYTLDPAEIYVTDGAYQFEGLVFHICSQPSAGDKLWRLRDPSGAQHLLTSNLNEYLQLIGPPNNWIDEGVLGYIVPDAKMASVATAPLYAAYDPNDGSHFYTMDFAERENATNNLGMKANGFCCYLYKDGQQPAGTLPLLRAYSKTTNDHVYTIRQSELDELTGLLGYQAEGTTGWVMPELPPGPPANPSATFGHPSSTPVPSTTNLRRVFGEFTNNSLVPAPFQGLTSFSNYIMNNMIARTCQPITGMSVEIDITEDIVCSNIDFGAKGFAFQINCESIGSQIIGWQQYLITLWGPSLIGMVNNWYVGKNYSIQQYTGLMDIADFTLFKGWKLKIDLLNDANANIVGVNYSAFDATSTLAAHGTQMIADIPGAHALGVAPIGSCQVVLVGPMSGSDASLSSGRGTITCTSSSYMRPGATFPPCVLDSTFTAESANSIYAALPDERARRFVQGFSTKAVKPNGRRWQKWLAGVHRGPPLPPPPPGRMKLHPSPSKRSKST